MPAKYTPEQRLAAFWNKVDKSGGDDACWIWTAAKANGGYGAFSWKSKIDRAHRISYELANGTIPVGMFVCHSCDNPPCCNPAHLWLGTCADNARDMAKKKRYNVPGLKGERHWSAKLTDEKVREIRRRYTAGGIMQKELATEYNISQTDISDVILRKIWTHVVDE